MTDLLATHPDRSTPERILQEFNQRALIYKTGIAYTQNKENILNLQDMMGQFKSEWEFKTKELYND